jgi:hypothetical protein
VSVLIVDLLEVVEVDDGNGQRLATPTHHREQRGPGIQQVTAVVCAGQRIFERLRPQLLLQAFVLRHLGLQRCIQGLEPCRDLLCRVALPLGMVQADA